MVATRSQGFFGQLAKAFPEDDAEYAKDVVMILQNVWYSSVTQWVHGVLAIGDIYRQLERTIDRLIPLSSRDLRRSGLAGSSNQSPLPVRRKASSRR
jgi:hypothetical protein